MGSILYPVRLKAGAKKGSHFNIKDKFRNCSICRKVFMCRGNAKYCWDCKKI